MKSFSEIEAWMYENRFEMSKAESGYYYCVYTNEDGTSNVIWMDSASEDAYDLATATRMAYEIAKEIIEKKYNEIVAWMNENGFEMRKTKNGRYYCIWKDAEITSGIVWMDLWNEKVTDLEIATRLAYEIVRDK